MAEDGKIDPHLHQFLQPKAADSTKDNDEI